MDPRSALPPAVPADRVDAILGGPVDVATRELFDTASGGDPSLLRALVRTGLGLGEVVWDGGRWRWCGASPTGRLADLIAARVDTLDEAQLAALRTLSEPWAKPFAVVTRAAEGRSDSGRKAPALTRRQHQVLALLARGLTAAAIARRLCLSPRTVAKYQEQTYRKLGTSDRLTTVLRAQRLGLLRVHRADGIAADVAGS